MNEHHIAAREVIAQKLREWDCPDWLAQRRAEIILARLAAHDPPILLEMQRPDADDERESQDCGHAAKWLAYRDPINPRSEWYCVFCELERLHELEAAAAEYVAADDALGGTIDTWTIEAVEKFDVTEKRFYALCRETAKARQPLGPEKVFQPLTHEFDSSRTCNYCGIAAEKVPGNADDAPCPARPHRKRGSHDR